jgi:3-keto-L-gulonate-6-phosphate decarboxylase
VRRLVERRGDPARVWTREASMRPIVQISLDLVDIDEALETAALALRAGVDWLEAGTPLILAEGLHGVRRLRAAFPDVPIVADLKTMDGGYLEAEMMAKAGATHVVVMARAHEETIRCVVKAGADFGCQVMGDNMVCPDMVAGAKWLEDLGCDYVIHHIGYDERRGIGLHRRVEEHAREERTEERVDGRCAHAGVHHHAVRRGRAERGQRTAAPRPPGERRQRERIRPGQAAREPVDDGGHGMTQRMGDAAPAIARANACTRDE